MTATATAPAGAPAPTLPIREGPVGSLAPRQLRLVATVLVALLVLTAVVGMLALSSRHGATAVARQSAEPLMIDAQAVDTSLSDADSTAAGSFLVGTLEPESLRQRYADDLAQAAAALSATTQQVGADPRVVAALRTIAVTLPTYAGIVETATFNQRQANYPLAAAYMAEASHLMRSTILPAAQLAYTAEHQHLAADQSRAGSWWLVVVAVLLFVVLLVALVVVQRRLSRQFRRTFNVPLAAATALVAVVGIWFVVAVVVQDAGVRSAASQGSTPVSTFTQARILALQMRADDELTLLSRDSVGSYQHDFGTAVNELSGLLAEARATAPAAVRSRAAAAQQALEGYRTAHARIRETDGTQGDLIEAITQASATGPGNLPAASTELDQALAAGIAASQQTFEQDMSDAGAVLVALMILIVPLLVVAAVLVLVGMQRRIDEYR